MLACLPFTGAAMMLAVADMVRRLARVQTVSPRVADPALTFSNMTRAHTQADLASPAMGSVIRRPVEAGDGVGPGAILVAGRRLAAIAASRPGSPARQKRAAEAHAARGILMRLGLLIDRIKQHIDPGGPPAQAIAAPVTTGGPFRATPLTRCFVPATRGRDTPLRTMAS